MSLESEYLKKCLGACLVQGLAKLVEHRPSDPIEYLALWIYEYRKQIDKRQQRMLENFQLSTETMESLLELEIEQNLKAEQIHFQKRYEEFQKKKVLETFPEPKARMWDDKFGYQKLPPLEEIDESTLSPNKENTMSSTDLKEQESDVVIKTGSQDQIASDAMKPT